MPKTICIPNGRIKSTAYINRSEYCHALSYVRSLDDSGSETGQVEGRIAESKWCQSGLTVHRKIYAKQRDVVSKSKKEHVCEKIIDCDSSRELFRLSNQMIGTFRGTVLPSSICPESLPDKFSEFFCS